MITSPVVTFGLYPLDVKPDSTPAATDIQSFSKIADLKTENVNPRPYATYEPNFWLLDGGYKLLPNPTTSVHCGWVSSSQSDGSGVFSSPPALTITFGSTHLADGLTIHFSQYTGDWANSINVKYYNEANTLVKDTNYAPSSAVFTTTFSEIQYKKIVITFNSTNKANRYLRVTGIDFGEMFTWAGADILSAHVVEEISMLGTEAPIGSADLLLRSADANFSVLNPGGDYARLQERQPLMVYEQVGDARLTIGKFYLTKWKNESETKIRFEANDLIGNLDKTPFKGGVYSNVTVATFADGYLPLINAPYELDADLANVALSGWIPYTTYREAFKQILFAAGGYMKCARGSILQLCKTKIAADETAWDTDITKAEKGSPQSLEMLDLVTGVDLTAHEYVNGSGTATIFSGVLPVGWHEIVFDKPYHNISGSGFQAMSSRHNSANVYVAVEGTVTITGTAWIDNRRVFSARLSGALVENIVKISEATLVGPGIAQAVVDRVFAYLSQRYRQTVRLYAPEAEVGNLMRIESLYGQYLLAGIEKMELNLAGGFIADTVANGVVYGLG